ncbi:glycoside hydrolase family 9 protein [Sphingomonas sp. LHG3406-1]|uniref:glycoside hydrolase family 9 protein n=1 Tax=Sphingomonas sp. LHG3406-1 TaxID=2804617 RepID=UPI002631348C|nr:glycoside hydrolase family 9 protein [Sphingomonas sp. LHG3406-1]
MPLTVFAIAGLLGIAPVADASAGIRLNQVGFTPGARKVAVLPSTSLTPLPWTIVDEAGKVRATGTTVPFGADRWSGEAVHRIDFTSLAKSGRYTLTALGRSSRPFTLSSDANDRLPVDALAFFYHQRAGTPIEASIVGATWARPAGHRPEVATCVWGKDPHGNDWPGCDWTLDVTGGWYDAGDHGKYVVNGGIALWTLLNLQERQPTAFPDGSALLPERGNGVPDLLDEARYQLEFFLRMQVPNGARISVPVGTKRAGPGMVMTSIDASGMVHHKVAGERWTGIPMRPDQDPEKRQLFAPTTGATLNFAAVTAQCARLWRGIDRLFADRCLAASRRAFAAAQRNPQVYAVADFTGSGGYGDDNLDDEFFWAAAELATTTGERAYRAQVDRSPILRAPIAGEPNWGNTAVLGLITLAGDRRHGASVRRAIIAAADRFVAETRRVGYAIPFAPEGGYAWGSTSNLLNRSMMLAIAHDSTGRRAYLDAVTDSMDFLLGRNPLDRSFVTGYGARPVRNPHHRFWANLPDRGFPPPPPGVIAGGPNSQNSPRADEPVGPLKGCAPQTCWVDDIGSFTTNEVAINWNAPLVWVSAWLKEKGR